MVCIWLLQRKIKFSPITDFMEILSLISEMGHANVRTGTLILCALCRERIKSLNLTSHNV